MYFVTMVNYSCNTWTWFLNHHLDNHLNISITGNGDGNNHGSVNSLIGFTQERKNGL